jgi:hypothetical protein
MAKGRFSISTQELYPRIGTAAAPLKWAQNALSAVGGQSFVAAGTGPVVQGAFTPGSDDTDAFKRAYTPSYSCETSRFV